MPSEFDKRRWVKRHKYIWFLLPFWSFVEKWKFMKRNCVPWYWRFERKNIAHKVGGWMTRRSEWYIAKNGWNYETDWLWCVLSWIQFKVRPWGKQGNGTK